MVKPWDADGPELAGREHDLNRLAGVIRSICDGTARTLVVSGDAGVGKTALVSRACASAPSEALVLAGGALPLASIEVPFLALRSAFRAATGPDVHAPALSGDARPDLLIQVDEWLTELSRLRPVILVIDDLQWADQSTLDVLMYVVAGPGNRRVGVIGTLRTDGAGAVGPVQRWLTDIRRLPGVEISRLQPLDLPDTEAQLGTLLGAPPHRSLVNEVFARSAGNPYLNRLLVSGLDAGGRHLPAGLPPDLGSAVLRSWRGMPAGARELTQILALGGRPSGSTELGAVAGSAFEPDDILALLHSAVDAGLLDRSPDGTYWFHHPIIAEVLEQQLDAGERRRWHGAFAALYQSMADGGAHPRTGIAVALADHLFLAGHLGDAYRWALTAAELSYGNGGMNDALRLLRRAVHLREELPDAVERPRDIWDRIRAAARESGALVQELEAIQTLLACIDKDEEPLETSRLMVRRMHLQLSTGRAFFPMADILEAERLAAAAPRGWEHALALAELAHAGMWHNEPGADAVAYQALALARESGDPLALTYGLTAAAMAANRAHRFAESVDLASAGAREAIRARDFWAYVHATYWIGNAQDPWTSEEYAFLLRGAREEMMAEGAPHTYIAKIAATEAASFLAVGAWRKCRAALRIVLSLDPGPMGDVDARLTAARLAQLQGRHDEAAVHLARAEELYQENSGYLNLTFDAVRAGVHVAAGRPEAAFAAAMAGATGPGPPPTMCEWLLPIAARALADQIQQAKDDGRPREHLLAAARDLQERFPRVLHEEVGNAGLYDRQVAAFNALYAAELGRARNEPANATQWAVTVDACRDGCLPWEEAYACMREVEALLLRGHHRHPQTAQVLRRGLALADELMAVPVQVALEHFAAQGRIPLAPVESAARGSGIHLPGLTPRERDILEYVVSGRTYGEIARSLTISEKTVSSHISNLLRKTGAANRMDLARLAVLARPDPGESSVSRGPS